VVLGIDGLDPRMLDESVARGELPAFARLFERGSVGRVDVKSAGLPSISPAIWTSFVTGQLPRVHGITAFVAGAPGGGKRLLGSGDRRTAAIWEIAVQNGLSVGVVNWWCTYPADPVRGFVVSDRLVPIRAQRTAEHKGAQAEHDANSAVYPSQLGAALLDLVPEDEAIPSISPDAAEAFDRVVFNAAARAREFQQVDVLLVYTRALDALSHIHWGSHEPRPGEKAPKSDAVADYLRRYDRMLAEFLDAVPAQAHFVLLSDHGFERGEGFPPGQHTSAATAAGVFLAAGPRIRRGARFADADLVDILPTLLELAGLPAGKGMPGQVHAEAFLEGDRTFVPRVEGYRRQAPSSAVPVDSVADDAIRERLRNLGYQVD
jgi:predicted AlkP superfamily phosphohydrolase/phosphomutase